MGNQLESAENNEEFCFLSSPIGWLRIAADAVGLTSISRVDEPPKAVPQVSRAHLKEAYRQLSEYFQGLRLSFSLPLNPQGTVFQRKVWDALTSVPFGSTLSYGELAARVGCPGGARAVGMANNRNPLLIVVPCHRIVGQDGDLVGYALGLEIKRQLLALEGIEAKAQPMSLSLPHPAEGAASFEDGPLTPGTERDLTG